jgi:hypothetical protein
MVYLKTKEQKDAEAAGRIIGLMIRLIAWSLIYSPFVLAFGSAAYYVHQEQGFGLWPSLVVGIIAASVLYLIVAALYGMQIELKKSNTIAWSVVFVINVFLVSGLPFLIGVAISLDLIGANETSLVEKVLVCGFGGTILAIPAYIGVTKSFRSDLNQSKGPE